MMITTWVCTRVGSVVLICTACGVLRLSVVRGALYGLFGRGRLP